MIGWCKMVKLLFGIHCHQPVENFYEVVDEAIEKAYKPFLKTAKKYPKFKFAVHYSGWLLEYIKNYSKETFKLLQDLALNGQIEFFSGGYYEPILAAIPSDDRKYQIEKLNKFIKENFDQTPKGLWLTERVWDSGIIPDITNLGIEYVIVDDYHFLSAGFKKENLYGYYITESNGYKVKLFPINKNLRYLIPFKTVDKIKEYLHTLSNTENPAGIIFDDGEKFGIWPKTYQWVYQQGWLENFLSEISNSKNIEFIHYQEYSENQKPLGIAYLPITSYHEMGEWSLFAEDFEKFEKLKEFLEKNNMSQEFEKFVKGNIWHNFLVKYPESNRIHKRFLDLSISYRDYKKNQTFLDNLLKSQCNDVLWHGIFGGLYLPNLRNNAYRFIIKAEKEIEKITKKHKKVEVKDINCDGYEEVKVHTDNLILIFDSKEAGQLTELSIKDKEFNFQNTLTRRKEGYHYKLLQTNQSNNHDDEGISTIHEIQTTIDPEKSKDLLIYDWYNKNSFIDHVTDESFNLDSFYRCNFREFSDFANQSFNIEYINEEIIFKREGGIYLDKKYDSTLIKKYFIKGTVLEYIVNLTTKYEKPLKYLLEFNFHFANLEERLRQPIYHGKSNKFSIFDEFTNKTIVLESVKDCDIFSYPINTISQSEKGVDITNQGLTIGFLTDFQKDLYIKFKLSVL